MTKIAKTGIYPRLTFDRLCRWKVQGKVGGLLQPAGPRAGSVDVLLSVVDVEFAGRRDQPRVLDDVLQLAGLVIDDDDGRLLVLGVPDGEPDFRAILVVFRLHDATRALGDAGPLADRQNLVGFVRMVDVEDGNAGGDLGLGIEGGVNPQVFGVGMGFDEERAATLSFQFLNHFPGLFAGAFPDRCRSG